MEASCAAKVCLLPRVVADILQEQDAAVRHRGGGFLDCLANAVLDEADGLAQFRRKIGGDRLEAELRLPFPLGTSKMAAENDPGPLLLEMLDRGQRGFDPAVVGDSTAFERHVEVAAHEDAFTGEVNVLNRFRGHNS